MDILGQILVPIVTLVVGIFLGDHLSARRERRQWKSENIWRPLYNNVVSNSQIHKTEIDKAIQSESSTVDAFARTAAKDRSLVSSLENYESWVDRFNKLFDEMESVRTNPPAELIEAVIAAFPTDISIIENGYTKGLLLYRREKGYSFHGPSEFIGLYWVELFSSDTPESLRAAIVDRASKQGTVVWIEKWFVDHPNLSQGLLCAVNDNPARELVETVLNARKRVIETADDLKIHLEKRI